MVKASFTGVTASAFYSPKSMYSCTELAALAEVFSYF